jgi:hypothetical protein
MDFLQADAAADSDGAGEQQQQQAASIDTLSTRHTSHHNYMYAHQVPYSPPPPPWVGCCKVRVQDEGMARRGWHEF